MKNDGLEVVEESKKRKGAATSHAATVPQVEYRTKTCPFFDQNIVNNNDVIYGHCVDGQKFYVVKKGQKSDKFSVF